MSTHEITTAVNGRSRSAQVQARTSLADLLRAEFGLTGTHVSCEQGHCGACTVLLDGLPVRSCLVLAVQVDGAEVETVENLPDGGLQAAMREEHGLQCGFCTPGLLVQTEDLLARRPEPSDAEIREALAGNLCRCTGYEKIMDAVRLAAERKAAHG